MPYYFDPNIDQQVLSAVVFHTLPTRVFRNKAIAGKEDAGLRRVNCDGAVNGLGRKLKTGAQAEQGQRSAGIVWLQGAPAGA